MNIQSKIKEIRKKKGLSQAEVAKASGLSATFISQIETGKKSPTLESLEKISDALGVPFPILSFLSLDESQVVQEKRSAFKFLAPSINNMVEEFFGI